MPDSLIDLADLQVGAEDFLVAVLETTAQPIWVVDPDGVIRFANPAGRLPPAVEATAYFVVSEALTNVAKHSRAERAEVTGLPPSTAASASRRRPAAARS